MDATARFDLGDREYIFTAPTSLQFKTVKKIIDSYYGEDRVRKKIGDVRHIVDVGACIGTMSLCYTTIWPDAEILAIEPHPLNFKYLVENCKAFKNIHPVCIALGDKEERIRLALPSPEQRPLYPQFSRLANVGMASRYGNSDNYVAEVDAVTLDSIVGWDVDLIKIDVEGSEVSVLRGAERTIEATHPFLVVEAREENQKMAGGSLEELSNSLKRLGYIHRWQWGGDACLQHPLRKPLWTHYS